MSGTRRVTLKPGDLVQWEPGDDEENVGPSTLLVADNGTDLLFQFGTKTFKAMYEHGLDVPELLGILNEGHQYAGPGYFYKAYDEATGRNFVNPKLLEPGEDL